MKTRSQKAFGVIRDALFELLPDTWAIQYLYFRNFKRFANLRSPETFSEKLNWRKLYQRDPRFTLYSDKAAVKNEIAGLIGSEHVIPTLWSGERPEDIPFDELVPPYVIKANHGYGSNVFIRRREDIDRKSIVAALQRELRHTHGRATRQWGYYDIPRKIIVERLLNIFGESIAEDHKFFVYHGRVHFIQIDVDALGSPKRAFYDRHWNKLPLTEGCPDIERVIARPAHLDGMIAIAEKIGAGFDFVRIDLYCEESRIFFGEASFYDSAGFGKPHPEIWDRTFGEPWKIPVARG